MADWPSASPNIACRLRLPSSQTIPNGDITVAQFATEDYNTVGTAMHDGTASAKALTGTVQKTSGSGTLTGTGTAFTTQVAVGDSITVPGGANETKTVSVITSDTSLTVSSNFANSSSGQSATVDARGRIYVPVTGIYGFTFGFRLDGGASVDREFHIAASPSSVGSLAIWELTTTQPISFLVTESKLSAGQFVCARVRQTTGANATLVGVSYTYLSARYVSPG